ncbi:outer membrane lipoprotein chaperone LolA [Myxococcota bacterium]|nr:outer membrane lipoprotein chaperone LolA [Myxococcota bacterium]
MITAVFLGCATLMLANPGQGADGAKKKDPPAKSQPAKDTPKKGEEVKTPAPAADPAMALMTEVQKYYDQTKDFSAEFTQLYTRVALSKTTESSGKVSIKKPGMMRWEYEKPAKKLFVADGTKLWVYEPEEEQVVEDKNFKTTELSSSISFLFGEGKLQDSFTAKVGDPAKYGLAKDARVLELVPKRDATYTRLVLVLDPKTSQVNESILYEASGNTNRFKFRSPKINSGIAASTFTFTPPPGVEVIPR